LHQYIVLGRDRFLELTVASSIIAEVKQTNMFDDALTILNSKPKKNVGDVVKHIVTDNFSVDLTFSINLRSLKNFLKLRLNASAYWQMQLLAYKVCEQVPEVYRNLIITPDKQGIIAKISNVIDTGEWY